MMNRRCGCEDGDDCTLTSVCMLQSLEEDVRFELELELDRVKEEGDRMREVIMSLEDWQHQIWGGGGKTLRQIAQDSTWQELRDYQEWRDDL